MENYATTDEYLSHIEPAKRAALERVRTIVKQLVPDAVESVSYGMPAFKYKGKPLIYFGAFKDHLSVFPTSGPTEILKDKLAGYKVTKGTIQFTTENQLPEDLITEIVHVRLAAIETP